jgi:hypothetical protein
MSGLPSTHEAPSGKEACPGNRRCIRVALPEHNESARSVQQARVAHASARAPAHTPVLFFRFIFPADTL